jgi:predicted PhzF superfamily epimerase YddE/YHI9
MNRRAKDIPFYFVDVFTDTPLAGNPLAVVADCEFLDDATLKRIARVQSIGNDLCASAHTG